VLYGKLIARAADGMAVAPALQDEIRRECDYHPVNNEARRVGQDNEHNVAITGNSAITVDRGTTDAPNKNNNKEFRG
jgi:hypothetical protein